jgi:hypothetical protein
VTVAVVVVVVAVAAAAAAAAAFAARLLGGPPGVTGVLRFRLIGGRTSAGGFGPISSSSDALKYSSS